jgi:hypothetical protein
VHKIILTQNILYILSFKQLSTTTTTTAIVAIVVLLLLLLLYLKKYFLCFDDYMSYMYFAYIYTHIDLICLYYYGTFHLRMYRTIILECPFLICDKCNCLSLKITQIFCMHIEFIYVKVML